MKGKGRREGEKSVCEEFGASMKANDTRQHIARTRNNKGNNSTSRSKVDRKKSWGIGGEEVVGATIEHVHLHLLPNPRQSKVKDKTRPTISDKTTISAHTLSLFSLCSVTLIHDVVPNNSFGFC